MARSYLTRRDWDERTRVPDKLGPGATEPLRVQHSLGVRVKSVVQVRSSTGVISCQIFCLELQRLQDFLGAGDL